MELPRIFLTGGSGQLGTKIIEILESHYYLKYPNRHELNIEEKSDIANQIRLFKPNIIINAAAFTNVDEAETNSIEAFNVNADLPAYLAQEARDLNIPLIHFSTDYIFDGLTNSSYLENDRPNPINEYGKSKLLGEKNVVMTHNQHIILRTSWVFNPNFGKNFYRTMAKIFLEHDHVKVVSDQYGRPTSVGYLSNILLIILENIFNEKKNILPWGIYHACEFEKMSWHTFAKKIYKLEKAKNPKLECKILPIKSKEWKSKALRPYNSSLNTDKINLWLGNH